MPCWHRERERERRKGYKGRESPPLGAWDIIRELTFSLSSEVSPFSSFLPYLSRASYITRKKKSPITFPLMLPIFSPAPVLVISSPLPAGFLAYFFFVFFVSPLPYNLRGSSLLLSPSRKLGRNRRNCPSLNKPYRTFSVLQIIAADIRKQNKIVHCTLLILLHSRIYLHSGAKEKAACWLVNSDSAVNFPQETVVVVCQLTGKKADYS